MTFAYPYALQIPEPVSADEIAWHLIRLWIDCGRSAEEIAQWLMRLEDTPMWPDPERLVTYMRDAGL